MAVAVTFRIDGATQDDHDRLGAAMSAAIDAAGGPPDGLLVHLAHDDDGGGFVSIEVFRSEEAFRAFWTDIAAPALASVGLTATVGQPRTVWSLARP